MQLTPTRTVWIAAGAVLLGGIAWAGSLVLSPVRTTGPDAATLRALAQRVEGLTLDEPALGQPTEAPAPAPIVVAKPAPKVTALPVARPRVAAPGPVAPPAPVEAPPPSDPTKSIALMGVTFEGGKDTAWLVDLDRKERENAAVGERAFGFTVKKIAGDAVVLARGSDEYSIRLGEKQIPTVSVVSSDAGEGGPGGMFPGGPGGFPFGGRGDRGGSGGFDLSRLAELRDRFGGGSRSFASFGGDGGWRSWGGGDSGRSWGGGGDSGRSWGGGGDSGRNRGSGGGGFSGGSPMMAMPFMGGWGGRGSSNQNQTGGPTATSNAQTARRRGTTVTGGGQAMPEPEPITNPQTQRRLGNTSGPAFGTTSPTGNQNQQRGGFGQGQFGQGTNTGRR